MSDSESPKRASPHDALFKLTFERPEHAVGALRSILPAAALSRMDLSTLELAPGSFRDAELRDVETDLLFRVQLAGREALLYVLLEHQSTVDRDMAFRLLRYMVRIWESWCRDHPQAVRLPAIVPVVVSHGERPWTAPTSLVELFELDAQTREAFAPWLVDFRFVLDDLAAQAPEALHARAGASPMARLTLFLLQRARDSDDLLAELRDWSYALKDLLAAGGDDLVAVVVYTWVVADVSPSRWRAFLRDALNTNPDDVMGAAEKLIAQIGPPKWLEQGREQGREQGKLEGELEGKAKLVLRLLARRFGPLSAIAEERVRAATADELDAMADRVLDASRIEDVLGP